MTIRYCEQITSIGLATCGKGGTRLAARLGIQTTRQTILRRIMDLPDSSAGSILFLGIDDFSFRRGYRFGTILVNLESNESWTSYLIGKQKPQPPGCASIPI